MRRGGASSVAMAAVLLLLLLCVGDVVPTRVAALPRLWGGEKLSTALTHSDRDVRIALLEHDVHRLRRTDLQRAHAKLYAAKAALDEARKKEGFVFTRAEDKATIRVLDEQFQLALVELQQIKAEESAMLAKLKPLYGVVSTQFAQEQRTNIAGAIATVQKMSYDNAWWSSLFNLGEAESLTDVVVHFLVQLIVGYVCLYPFALLYYALWTAPSSVFAYMSGVSDVVPALCAYVVSVTLMSAPLIALAVGYYVLHKRYRISLTTLLEQTSTNARRRRHRYAPQPHYHDS